MEISSDSSCDSVVITGPTEKYSESKSHHPSSVLKQAVNENSVVDCEDIALEDKVERIQELEDLVNATATLPADANNRDVDPGTWSDSDTRSTKESKKVSVVKYLKKIKTLQQNKRRQETRISKLTKEVRTLKDKNSIQAAYIDVLCGILGDDVKEKFKGRQGLGILGNLVPMQDDDDALDVTEDKCENGGIWKPDDEEATHISSKEDGDISKGENNFYCIENLEDNSVAKSNILQKPVENALIPEAEEPNLPVNSEMDNCVQELQQ